MPNNARQPHPMARLFSRHAREAVANGPLFRPTGPDTTPHREDGCCVIGALIHEDFPGVPLEGELRMPGHWTTCVMRERLGRPLSEWREKALQNMMGRNDRGDYADPQKLRRDLLGEVRP